MFTPTHRSTPTQKSKRGHHDPKKHVPGSYRSADARGRSPGVYGEGAYEAVEITPREESEMFTPTQKSKRGHDPKKHVPGSYRSADTRGFSPGVYPTEGAAYEAEERSRKDFDFAAPTSDSLFEGSSKASRPESSSGEEELRSRKPKKHKHRSRSREPDPTRHHAWDDPADAPRPPRSRSRSPEASSAAFSSPEDEIRTLRKQNDRFRDRVGELRRREKELKDAQRKFAQGVRSPEEDVTVELHMPEEDAEVGGGKASFVVDPCEVEDPLRQTRAVEV